MSTADIIAELPRLSAQELAQIQAKISELVAPSTAANPAQPVANHPAIGTWKDRTDLPQDPVEASKLLREKMTRPANPKE